MSERTVPADVLARETTPPPVRKTAPVSSFNGELTPYAEAALRGELEKLRATPPGNGRHTRLYAAAAALGELVAGGSLPRGLVVDELRAAAGSLSAEGREREVERTIKDGLRDGAKQPRAPESRPPSGKRSAPQQSPAPADDSVPAEPDWREEAPHSVEAEKESSSTAAEGWLEPIPFDAVALPPFPLATLPAALRSFVESEATATRTPPDLAGCLVLAAVSACIAKKIEVSVRPGWIEPTNQYVAVVLRPGQLKSAVVADTTRPLEEYEAEELVRAEPALQEAEVRAAILEKRLRKTQEQAAKAQGPESRLLADEATGIAMEIATASRVKARPRLLADDATPEKLGSLLAEQGGRLAVLSAEGTLFEVMAGRYSGSAAPNFEVILRAHSGDTIRVDRVGRPSELVTRPALTIGLAVQPDVLHSLTAKPGFRGRGLLGRFLYSLPPDLLGYRDSDPPTVSAAHREEYAAVLSRLLRLPAIRGEDGNVTATRVPLSSPAHGRLVSFMCELEPRLRPDGDLGLLTDWAGKLAGAVARIAGVLHLADLAGAYQEHDLGEIPAETLDRAVTLGEYFLEHAKAAFEAMGSDPAIEDAKTILAWVRAREVSTFTQRDLHAAKRSQFHKSEDTLPGLRVLDDRGYIRQRPVEKQGPGRPPSPVYDVNPATLEVQW